MSLASILHDALTSNFIYSGGQGRGVVIVGGGKYLPSAYLAIRHLRASGCQLPIQLWHLGPSDLPGLWPELSVGLNVTAIDALTAIGAADFRRLGGWECKVHALVACPFSQVLLIDADNIPLADPTFIFDSAEFARHGQVFWPDFVYHPGQRYALRSQAYRDLGLDLTNGLELESGQLAIDRERCWHELQICRLLNVHSDQCYGRWTWGDKDTFTLAWLLTKRPYCVVPRRPRFIDPPKQAVFWQHWFDGRRLFQHQRKWFESPEKTAVHLLDGELHKEQSLEYLQDYYRAASRDSASTVAMNGGRIPESRDDLNAHASPVDANAWHALATQAYECGDYERAVRSLQDAVAKAPAVTRFRTDLAAALSKMQRPADALPHLLHALGRGAATAELHNNLGVSLQQLNRFAEAAAAFRNAIAMKPEYLQAHHNLGEALRKAGDPAGSIAAFEEALRHSPESIPALQGLVTAAEDLGDIKLTLSSRRRLVELEPDAAGVRSALLYTLHYDPAMDREHLYREHLEWDQRFGQSTAVERPREEHGRLRSSRIRVGYVSPDFRNHTVPRFIGGALRHHDRSKFEVFCYSDVTTEDATTELLRGYVEHWRDIVGLPDERAEQLIREDAIDILIDLRGHAAGNRLTLFARKPAPVQLNMVGYFDTTGLSAMDYRVTDEHQDPPGIAERYSRERLLRIPGTSWCYTADENAPDIAPPPVERNGYITFGSLNKLIKITEPCSQHWAKVLDAVPGSRLLLHVPSESAAAAVGERLTAMGLPARRLELVSKARSRHEYLERFGQVDIALDTFPFNGITTTCDGLWMGVPLLSLSGTTGVSRAGRSILHGVGLPHLAATTSDTFVQTAADLAGDRISLAQLRQSLRGRMTASRLMNHAGFTRSMESYFERIWHERHQPDNSVSPGGANLES